MEKKKNNKPYIIASLHFNTGVISKPIFIPKNEKPVQKKVEIQKKEKVKPILKDGKRRTSALSLTSIGRKEELKVIEVEYEEFEGLPTDNFTDEKANQLWKKYVNKLQEKGKKSVASIMNASKPVTKGNEIHFELPNSLMKDQLDRAKGPLLKYLRENLNNFKTTIVINVNEEVTKKYAYTPQEKYQKLKEKNSAIELLKKTFDLDL